MIANKWYGDERIWFGLLGVRYMFDITERRSTDFLNGESNEGLSSEVAKFLVMDENLISKLKSPVLEMAV